MEDLRTLVLDAQTGNLDAFNNLVRRFQDMAVGYAYAILRDFQFAEDAAQEAFISAWLFLDSLREPKAFAGWLRRLVFTLVASHLSGILRGVLEHGAGPCRFQGVSTGQHLSG